MIMNTHTPDSSAQVPSVHIIHKLEERRNMCGIPCYRYGWIDPGMRDTLVAETRKAR